MCLLLKEFSKFNIYKYFNWRERCRENSKFSLELWDIFQPPLYPDRKSHARNENTSEKKSEDAAVGNLRFLF